MLNLLNRLLHNREVVDPTASKECVAPIKRPVRTQKLQTTGVTSTSEKSCVCSAPARRVLHVSHCESSMYVGGMPRNPK